jgi:hypothetical protein
MMFGALTCLASVLLLDLSFISTHYWAHYVAMFVPFANIISIYAYILFRDTNSPSFNDIALRRKGEFTIFIVLISFMILSATYSLEYALKLPRIGLSNFAINDRDHDRKLLNVLRQARKEGASFYVLRDPVYHRKLDHRRLGDAHPFMLETVLRGDRIGPVGDIFLYGDRVYADPCQSLLSSEKDIIILASPKLDREAWLCLTRADSNYVDLSELADEDGSVYFQLNKLDNYGIFVRRPR